MKTLKSVAQIGLLLLVCTPVQAQNKIEQFLQDALTRVVGADKLAQLKATTKGINILNRSWDVTDAMGGKARITTTSTGACFEKLGSTYKVCSNYSGVETSRSGYLADKQSNNGEYAAIVATQNGLVIEWSYRDCSSGYVQTWAMGNQLLSNGMGPANVKSTQEPGKCEGA
jgi:hypothetical protein